VRDALKGGDAETNATALMAVLKGNKGPYRDIAILFRTKQAAQDGANAQ
jgi:anthranilate phosphoribosyltransferase